MQPIEVKASFDSDGKIKPLSIRWQNQEQRVETLGRRWQAEDGLHILVLLQSGFAIELRFAPADSSWYLVKAQPGAGVAESITA
jgi:hypothetical protein